MRSLKSHDWIVFDGRIDEGWVEVVNSGLDGAIHFAKMKKLFAALRNENIFRD